jgi:tetratricopeptide (TPR) repeat protein
LSVLATDNIGDRSKDLLSETIERYAKESKELKGERTNEFRSFWEKEFVKVLEKSENSSVDLRFWMLGELGAIQRGAGNHDRSFTTFQKMKELGIQTGNLEAISDGLSNQFALVYLDIKSKGNTSKEKEQQLISIAKEHVDVRLKWLKTNEKAEYMITAYLDTMFDIGSTLLGIYDWKKTLLKNEKTTDNKKIELPDIELVEIAENCIKKSVSIPIKEHPAQRYFRLAEAQTLLNKKDDAIKNYDILLKLPDQSISKLWVEELKVLLKTEKGSDEYLSKMEKILDKYKKEGVTDTYESSLKYRMGQYFSQKENYEKSNLFFSSSITPSTSENHKAYTLARIADNYRRMGLIEESEKLKTEIHKKYSDSPIAKMQLEDSTRIGSFGEKVMPERNSNMITVLIIDFVLLILIISSILYSKRLR